MVEAAETRCSRPLGSSGLRISSSKVWDTFHLPCEQQQSIEVAMRAGGSKGGRGDRGAQKVGCGRTGTLWAAAGGCCCAAGRPIDPDG